MCWRIIICSLLSESQAFLLEKDLEGQSQNVPPQSKIAPPCQGCHSKGCPLAVIVALNEVVCVLEAQPW